MLKILEGSFSADEPFPPLFITVSISVGRREEVVERLSA